jgi:hypothetical protein
MSSTSFASTPQPFRRIAGTVFPKPKPAHDLWPALIMIGAVAGILVTLCSIFPPRWETNDDIAMSMAAHGYGLAAIGTPDLVFSNVVWGCIVRATPTVLGTLGYSVAALAVLAITAAAVTLGVGLLSGRALIGISAGLLIMVRPVLFPQFTLNAGLLAAAAIACWHLFDRHRNPIPLVAGCILLLTGFLVRDLECILVLAVALPIVPWRSLLWSRGGRIAMIAIIALAGAATVLDQRAYQTFEWESFNELNPARVPFTDFGAAESLRQRPEILARHRYSLNDIALLQSWFFVDPAIADPAELRAMVRELPLTPTRRSLSDLWAALQPFWHPNLLPLVLVALMLGILRPSWKVAASWILCCLAVMAIGYLGRPGILRIYVPLVSLLVIAPIIVDRDAGARSQLAMICIVVAGAPFCIFQVSSQSYDVHVDDKAVRAALNGFPNEPVVAWGADLPYEALYPVLGRSPAQDFHLYALATFTRAPFSLAMAEERAGHGFVNRLTGQAGLPFIASQPAIHLLTVYCREHLDGTLERLEERQHGYLTLQRYHCKSLASCTLPCTLSPFELNAGQSLQVGPLQLAMQTDGNLVLYQDGNALWATSFLPANDVGGFSGPSSGLNCAACLGAFQGDGNLVLYNNSSPYWASGTVGASAMIVSATAPFISFQ